MITSTHPSPSTTFEIEANRPPWSPAGARPVCTHARTMRGVVGGVVRTVCTACKTTTQPAPARTWVFRAKCPSCSYVSFESVVPDTGTGRPPVVFSGLLGYCQRCLRRCESTWESPDGTPYTRGNMVLVSELSR